MADVYYIKDLEQIKALSEPLRVRILESLTRDERTTKQVAELLGEPPTKLYRHVDQLHRVGLLELVRTNTVNGIVEKYYKAVARSISVDRNLFTSGPELEILESAAQSVLQLLETTLDEVRDSMRIKIEQNDDLPINLNQLNVVVTKEEALELAEKITELIRSYEAAELTEGKARFRVSSLIFPLFDSDSSADEDES